MTSPPDRSHILTEQRNPRSMSLHAASVTDCVRLIAEEDRSIADAMDRAGPALVAFIEAVEPRFIAGGRLIYVGAGTSGRLGVLDASEAPPTFCVEPGRIVGIIAGGDTALRQSSEGKEDDPRGAERDLQSLDLAPLDTVLGIAAGGTTPYVLGALELAKGTSAKAGVLTGFLTCAPMARPAAADHVIVIDTGPEVLTGSTRMKAGTATKLALNTISTTLMVRSGRVYENLMVDLRATNDKLRDRAARIVSTLTGLPRDRALSALDGAGGGAKTAVVMARMGLDRSEAEERLRLAGDRLDVALNARG
jgi:N-acetylmuramic acid 6-phosphate etherase